MDVDFVKTQSDNLPTVDSFMVADFLKNNTSYSGAEVRGDKMKRSARETYGDDAIGYVQVKRRGDICTVKAKITPERPEHKVRNKGYSCVLKCNERDEQILSAECLDCAAHKGGCKHSVAFLMWLHRRSEEASPTESKCYWAKEKDGTTLKFIKAKDFGTDQLDLYRRSSLDQSYFLKKVTDVLKNHSDGHKVQLFQYFKEHEGMELSVHFLYHAFMKESRKDVENFLKFCSTKMTNEKCKNVEQSTLEKSESSMWFELRYCRITASNAYEAAHCKRHDGALVEQVFGGKKNKDPAAKKRRKKLKDEVRSAINQKRKITIEKSGLFLKGEWPVLAASPDGVTKDYVIEIKCPTSAKKTESYIKDGVISNKCKAQIQLQMFFTGKRKGLFCVASPQFEQDKSVTIHKVDYDEIYCLTILSESTAIWKKVIFKKLQENF